MHTCKLEGPLETSTKCQSCNVYKIETVETVPALDESLLHPGGPLRQRSACWVLTHHWEKLQQQLGALRLPGTTLPTDDAKRKREADTVDLSNLLHSLFIVN